MGTVLMGREVSLSGISRTGGNAIIKPTALRFTPFHGVMGIVGHKFFHRLISFKSFDLIGIYFGKLQIVFPSQIAKVPFSHWFGKIFIVTIH